MTSLFSRIAAVLLVALVLWVDARAQEEDPTVEVTEGAYTVGFTPPPNCQELSDEAKTLINKQGANLKYGCVTPQKDALIFLMMADRGGGGEQALADFERGLKDGLNASTPGIKWLGRDTVKMSGGKWVRLRYREGPAETDLINTLYFTDWAGKFITFVGGAPASQYERIKAALEKSAKSIELSISVIAPAHLGAPDVKEKP